MNRFLRILIVMVMVLSTFIVPKAIETSANSIYTIPSDTSTGSVQMDSSFDKLLSHSQTFRESLGYETEVNYIKSIYENSKAKQFIHGAILTEEEQKDLESRLLRQNKINDIVSSLNNYTGDEVSGVFIDQLSGGIINIGYKNKRTIDFLKSIKSNLIESEYINFYQVIYSEEDIKKLKDQIRESIDEIGNSGIEITGVGTSIQRQKVIIYVKKYDDIVVKTLNSMFGSDRISVEQGEQGIPQADELFQGGDYATVGSTFYDAYYNNTTADVGYVENNLAKNTTSYILTAYNKPMSLKVASRMLNDYEGLIVHTSLGNSDLYLATTVLDIDYDINYGTLFSPLWLREQKLLNANSAVGGDSGSPVFYWCGTACGDFVSMYGIHSGRRNNDDKHIVSYITNIEDELNISIETSNTDPITTTIP